MFNNNNVFLISDNRNQMKYRYIHEHKPFKGQKIQKLIRIHASNNVQLTVDYNSISSVNEGQKYKFNKTGCCYV